LSITRRTDQHVTKCDIVWNGLRNAKMTWIGSIGSTGSIFHIGGHSFDQIMKGEMGGVYGT